MENRKDEITERWTLDLSNKEKLLKKIAELRNDNLFYARDAVKIWKAVSEGQGESVTLHIDAYSSKYKGGILMYTIGNGEEDQLTKKKIKIADLKYHLPIVLI